MKVGPSSMRFPPFPAALAAFVLLFALSACGAQVDGAATPQSSSDSKAVKRPSGVITIAQEKSTVEVEECELLTPEEIAEILDATPGEGSECYMSFTNPHVSLSINFATPRFDVRDEVIELEVGGNTAYQLGEKRSCEISIMLTDDREEYDAALQVSLRAYDKADLCGPALEIATKLFEKLPST